MRTSCINHPPNEPLIVIRHWQVELCGGNTTAAALLSFFEYWHNIKLEMQGRASRSNDIAEAHGDNRTQDESLLQFHTEEELISGIMIAKRDTIRKALGYLKDCGFISIHTNPNPKYAFDKTRYFLFHPGSINKWLNEKRPLSNSPLSKAKNRQRSSENQLRSSENQLAITEITPEISSETTLPPTPQGGEVSEEGEQPRNEIKEGRHKSPVLNINPSLTSEGVNGDIKQSTVIYEDNYSGVAAVATINYAALGMQDPNNRKTRQMREFNWVPDGPWKVDNKLDNNFVDWLTAKWVRDYGKDVHTTRANVQRHLKKDAANFAIAWDEYHREHLHRFSNAAVRERSGGVLSPEEQQKLLQHSAAVTQAVPEEIASINYSLPAAVEEFTPDIAAKLSGLVPALPQGAENPVCYQEWKPAESVADISPEEAATNIKRLQEMMLSAASKLAMPQIERAKPRSVVENLMADLADPVIRFSVDVQVRAQRFVGGNEEWCADYNDGGMIVAIYQF